jgi:hypothetical protein
MLRTHHSLMALFGCLRRPTDNQDSVVSIAATLQAARSGVRIADPSGRSLTGIVGTNPTGGMDVCVVCCKDGSMERKVT